MAMALSQWRLALRSPALAGRSGCSSDPASSQGALLSSTRSRSPCAWWSGIEQWSKPSFPRYVNGPRPASVFAAQKWKAAKDLLSGNCCQQQCWIRAPQNEAAGLQKVHELLVHRLVLAPVMQWDEVLKAASHDGSWSPTVQKYIKSEEACLPISSTKCCRGGWSWATLSLSASSDCDKSTLQAEGMQHIVELICTKIRLLLVLSGNNRLQIGWE